MPLQVGLLAGVEFAVVSSGESPSSDNRPLVRGGEVAVPPGPAWTVEAPSAAFARVTR